MDREKTGLKILWHSNAPWAPTGYGNQTALVTPKLQREHQVTISAYYGLEGHILRWLEGIEILPRQDDPFGADVIETHAKARDAELVFTLMDVWVLPQDVMGRLPWAAWCPVDSEPLPPAVADMLRVCRWPIAMSQFGLRQMELAGISGATYIPHGVDTTVFTPADRADARTRLAEILHGQHERDDLVTEKTFLVAMVAANKGMPSRKAFPEALTAWKLFHDQYPDSHLYLHTESSGRKGVHLEGVIELLGIDPDSVSYAPQYAYDIGGIGPGYLNTVYNAADVLLNPAYGEGFGIPIVEAQAAGCPVIVGDNTAMRELCFAGWKVLGAPLITPLETWQFKPVETELVAAMKQAYAILGPEASGEGRDDLRNQARIGALAYDAETVYRTYWEPFLAQVAQEIRATQAANDYVQALIGAPNDNRASLDEKRAARAERYREARQQTPQEAAAQEA